MTAEHNGMTADYNDMTADYNDMTAYYNGMTADYNDMTADYNNGKITLGDMAVGATWSSAKTSHFIFLALLLDPVTMATMGMDYLKKVSKDLSEAERLRDVDPANFKDELNRLLKSVERFKRSVSTSEPDMEDVRKRAVHQAAMLKASALALGIQKTLRELQERSEDEASGDYFSLALTYFQKYSSVCAIVAVIVILVVCVFIFD
ncbi:hypothetical protein Btru_047716 [Bulinus truncatus]|nr:hypothetical protein Btru_047716 [Bulinus truncatus]